MKALFLYSRFTGSSFFIKRLDYIERQLSQRFSPFVMKECHNLTELKNAALEACKSYDYLIFVGGDGTLNTIINFIADEPHKPILGYIPGGTTNDFAKNFHLKKDIRWSVNNLLKGEVAPFDICKANNRYFAYVLATGIFSEISYSAKRSVKKRVGNLAYYMMAIKDVFRSHKVSGTLFCNGEKYDVDTPFFLVLNGHHVGGFCVNQKNQMNDNKFHIFVTKPGLFNGLLHYLFFKIRTLKLTTDEFIFKFKNKSEAWCLDGEMADLKDVYVKCYHSHLQMVVPHKIAKRLKRQGL